MTNPAFIQLTEIRTNNKSVILVPVGSIVAYPAMSPSPPGANSEIVVHGSHHFVAETMTQVVALANGEKITVVTPLASLTWRNGEVTAKTASPHGFTVGATQSVVIADAVPAGYNGTFTCTVVDADTLTYPLALDPGAETAPGTYAVAS